MADNIVGGLFGVDPAVLQRQQQEREYAQDYRAVQLDPMQQSKLAILQGTRAFGRGVGGLLGMEDPELAKASKIKQVASQINITTPDGLRQLAAAIKDFAPQEAMMAIAEADKREQTGLGLQKTKADISKAELSAANEEKLRAELSEAVARGAKDSEIISIVSKYGSADKILQELSRKQDREAARAAKAAGAGEGGVGTPGPVGKSGAYRDITGQILGPTEMKTVRQEFETNQRLLNTLNNVNASDVKDAESFVDWTTKGESKALANKATLNAQSKIAASQLLEQIGQLPPGSASDADMRAAMKSFPGYSNPEALAEWVNRTKERLQFHIGRSSEQFGFKPTVNATAPIDLKAKSSKAGSSRENPIKLD